MSGAPAASRWAAGPTALSAVDVEALALCSHTDGAGPLERVSRAAAGGPAWVAHCRSTLEWVLDLVHAESDLDAPWEQAQADLVHLWVVRGIGEEIARRTPRLLGPPS